MSASAFAQRKPNIVVIMGDDIGITNIGVYGHGMMAGKTPNLDKIAKEGMLFTDYYAEASCTARNSSSTVSMLYLMPLTGCGGNGPASSIFCLPILPQRGISVSSSLSVAQLCTMLRGPTWFNNFCG